MHFMVKEQNISQFSNDERFHGEGRMVKEEEAFFLHHKHLCISADVLKVKG